MSSEKSIKEMLQEEVDARIEEIESEDYEYVAKLNKADYIGIALTAISCIVLIVIGII